MKNLYFKKIAISVFLVFAFMMGASCSFDTAGEKYIDRSLENAVYTYGTARAINGAISVLQGTDLQFSPAGVGVTIAVGEVLDPVNDTVEKFSSVMLVALTSLGIQKLLLEISSSAIFAIILLASISYAIVSLWLDRWFLKPEYGVKALVVVVALRFGIAVILLANDAVYQMFMEEEYTKTSEELEISSKKLDRIKARETEEVVVKEIDSRKEVKPVQSKPKVQEEGGSWLSRFYDDASDKVSEASESIKLAADDAVESVKSVAESVGGTFQSFSDFDAQKEIEEMKEAASETFSALYELIVIFTMQTVIIPIIFLWLYFKFFSWLLHFRFTKIANYGRRFVHHEILDDPEP